MQPLGLAEHLFGGALHHNASAAHDQYAVGLGGFLHIVGNGHNGNACIPQVADGFHYLGAAAGVQHGSGFIQNQAVRPHGNHARDGNALLLTAGKLVRRFIALFIDPRQLHGVIHAGAHFPGGHAKVFQRKGNVLFHHGGNDLVVRVLEHHAHFLANVVQLFIGAGVHIFHQHGAAFWQQNGVKMLGQGRFAAAVGTQHSHKLAAVYFHRHPVHSKVRLLRIIPEPHILRL